MSTFTEVSILVKLARKFANLPNIHQVVRSPAEDKSDDEDPSYFYCFNLGFSKHSTVVYRQDLGPPVDDNDDGDVAEYHHKERQHPGQTKDEYEVEELL